MEAGKELDVDICSCAWLSKMKRVIMLCSYHSVLLVNCLDGPYIGFELQKGTVAFSGI